MSPKRLKTMLRRIREEKGLTQEQVVKKAGVTKQYITMLESGVRKAPTLPVLQRLASALGVPVSTLHEEDDHINTLEFARGLLTDPEYMTSLAKRLRAGTVPKKLLTHLIAHARDPLPTEGRAYARRVLRAAGVSWDQG